MFTGLGAFVATTVGKVFLGTAVAAASVGGAHAANLIDVPGLPEAVEIVDTVEIEPTALIEPEVEGAGVSAEVFGDAEQDGDAVADPEAANDGATVSEFAATTELQGCERGQAIAEIASSNAADHRQNEPRTNNPCDKGDDDGDDGEETLNADGDAAVNADDEAVADADDEAVADADGDAVADPEAADDANHGATVSEFAATTELQGCERGQAIAEIASSNAADHRQNEPRTNNPCDKDGDDDADDLSDDVEEQVDTDGEAAADADADVEAEPDANHGATVSEFAATTELQGCERGQAIAEIASSNAADHRQNEPRTNNPCDKDKDDDDDGSDDGDLGDDVAQPLDTQAVEGAVEQPASDTDAIETPEPSPAATAGRPDHAGRPEGAGRPDHAGRPDK